MAASVFRDSQHSHRGHVEVAQINITPLVDVMLVLLVIFMVATPVMTGQIDLRIPQATDSSTRTKPPPRVELKVEGNDRFTLDGVALTRAELPQALRELAQAEQRPIVQISANADADYQDFAWTLAEAQHNGVRDIAWQ
ncbi:MULTISPECIES: biopolymer transporter ExbD [unclassified Lysobacter]|uniref:ExbD/TolR family protein n=1 Tax=unclassified Lysobacter TaxID=2635362 RepID=UPI001C238733|nr:biopolymer transporter ExbD [Lysobacter sp. MMG2]MBU8977164.1 biopolymer transporter ExbD [Lysobacter sp. MMG2]